MRSSSAGSPSRFAILLLGLALAGCISEGDERDYAVYSAVIEGLAEEKGLDAVTIRDFTHYPSHAPIRSNFGHASPRLEKSTLDDFLAANAVDRPLERRFSLKGSYRLASPGDKAREILGLSAVGYSESGDQALVFVEELENWDAGLGYLFLLQRAGDTWQVVGEEMVGE